MQANARWNVIALEPHSKMRDGDVDNTAGLLGIEQRLNARLEALGGRLEAMEARLDALEARG